MREIKFRGRVPDKGWLYGDLRHIGNNLIYIVDKFGHGSSVNPNIVGQYTGLEDADGREIYEGDIVRFELPPMVLTNEKTAVGVVVYEYGQFLVIIHSMRFTIFSIIKDCTVIGNIYDDPELLRLTKTGGFDK